MNQRKETSPEEKLLNLIRGSSNNKKKTEQEETDQRLSAKSKVKNQASQNFPYNNKDKLNRRKNIFYNIKFINYIVVNRFIWLIVFILSSFLILDIFLHSSNAPEFDNAPQSHLQNSEFKQKVKPFDYYSRTISKRELFNPKFVVRKRQEGVSRGPSFKELIKNLRLLGIVFGDRPQAIIEDESLRKTYFLYAGDYLGQIKIEHVYSDRVILEFKGEKSSLFL